jgi:hypothetical protein
MEKLAQAGEGGGARPPPFTKLTITYKVAVYAPAEWADALTLFHLYQYILETREGDMEYTGCSNTEHRGLKARVLP